MVESKNTCGLNEELIAFLYQELSPRESDAFMDHVGACDACADEMAALASVRGSMLEWKMNVGESPSHAKSAYARTSTPQRGFFEKIFSMLDLSFGKASLGFASLMFVALAGWAIFSFVSANNEVAENSVSPKQTVARADINSKSLSAMENSPINTSESKSIPNSGSVGEVDGDLARVNQISSLPSSSNVSNRNPTASLAEKRVSTASKSHAPKRKTVTPKNSASGSIDRLTEQFAIDNSDSRNMRLTDLLDEVAVVND